ncbi:SDR family NAD(P)-dependent oxidoreductase [[Mycobacterium] burgundiense]|uniref:SDR family oxidoreductase n=1 Tax=[Mycobacterium] burgundiense TaxID=3064286 RepID=A0ABM9LUC4_9MYCO|nr:SDR family oxidoreductase [Mycolicibacterium sp. MU0053]CAJ1504878.1 SDR family oxidoreductase [Mycolicibacterium sp. MU0053]
MVGQLADKVAVVMGSGRGIGAAIAQRFSNEGATVVIVDVSDRAAKACAGRIGASAIPMRCDVANEDDVAATLTTAVAHTGGLDILVNNAALGSATPMVETTRADWDRVLGITLNGTFHTMKHAVPHLRRRGGGAILNISSIAGRHGMPSMAAYSAAKAGVDALTRTAAVELRADNIRVNAIVPGMIRTAAAAAATGPLSTALGMPVEEFITDRQQRWGEPDEVAAVATHLAGGDASFTTGMFYLLDNASSLMP